MKSIKIDLPKELEQVELHVFADEHMGDPHSDIKRLMQRIEYVKNKPNAYLREVCKRADATGAELTISIHCNASATRKGYGTECWTWKGAKVPQAVKICSQMAKLGFRNRGIKDGRNLYVIRNTKAETVIVELFFLDNYTDRKLYLDKGAEAIADAIAAAI